MVGEAKRQRGGQKGNRNALKHGYYARIFDKPNRADFCSAGNVEGIDEEIALLRHVIKAVASSKDAKDLSLLVKAANALNKLIRTRHKIFPSHQNQFAVAIGNVLRDIFIPLGIDPLKTPLAKKYLNDETNDPQNEVDFP